MKILILVAIWVGVHVVAISFRKIRTASRRPADNEVQQLLNLEKKVGSQLKKLEDHYNLNHSL